MHHVFPFRHGHCLFRQCSLWIVLFLVLSSSLKKFLFCWNPLGWVGCSRIWMWWWSWKESVQTPVIVAVGLGCFGNIALMLARCFGSLGVEGCSLRAIYIAHWWYVGMLWHWLPSASFVHMLQLWCLQGPSGQCFEVVLVGIATWLSGPLGCNLLHVWPLQTLRCTHLFQATPSSTPVILCALSVLSVNP